MGVTIIDLLGRETRYVYDPVGRLIETIYADDTVETWRDNPRSGTEYYTDGLVKVQIDERGNRTEFRYDAVGRQIAVIAADKTPNTLADNPTSRYTYDQAGQQKTVTDALGHVTTYEYDDLGRMVKTIFHDKTFVTQEYDKLGRRVAAVDQNSQRTEYRYDDLGRLTGVKDALLQWTEYGYNEQGQLVFQEDALDRRTTYEYDSLGRRTATILPMQQRSTTEYDLVGNVKAMTDFNGRATIYSYDEQNRLIQKSFQDGTKVVYTYTRNGQRDTISFKTASGTITELYDWDYDERDRLVRRVDEIDGISRSISYTYDVASNRTSVTTASGTTLYEFDERNRLDIVRQNGTIITDYAYDAVNNLVSTKLGNGTEEIRQYDALNRLKYLENRKLDAIGTLAQVISSFSYDLDKFGNRTKITEHSGRTSTYTYDNLYRLTRETIDEIGTVDDRAINYSYDCVGNRLQKQETLNEVTTQTEYDYDANDRLLWEKVNGVTTTTYTYDNNGSTRTKVENGVTTTYTWNDDKRLVAATITNAHNVVQQQLQYHYNDDGIRIVSVANGIETRYLLDEVQAYPQVLEEYAPNGTVQVSYIYGNDLISQTQVGQTTYHHVDGLGSTTELTDTNGNVVSSSRYDAFGNSGVQTGSVSNKYLFTGEQLDEGLGDYYLRDRFYESDSGRFLRQDSYHGQQAEPLTLHKYTYTQNDPVNGIDPTGFFTIAEFAAADSIRNTLVGMHVDGVTRFVASIGNNGSSFDDDILRDLAITLAIPVIGVFVSALAKAAKAYIAQGGWLLKHEKDFGGIGHTISRHVGVDDSFLFSRLAETNKKGKFKYSEVSTFTDQSSAEKVIKEAVLYNKNEIRAWRQNSSAAPLVLNYSGDGSTIVGRGIKQGQTSFTPKYGARLVLVKKNPSSRLRRESADH